MIGRRLQPVKLKNGRMRPPTLKPGDYCGPIHNAGELPVVYFLKPNARDADAPEHAKSLQHVVSPPHVFSEMPDGSLQIRESISDKRSRQSGLGSDGWHGYLDAGHEWRKV